MAPKTKDQAVASNQEPATSDVQEAPIASAMPNPISKLRELFGGTDLHGRGPPEP